MLFLLFTKQKGPRRGAARRKTSGECGQRFISLTGPVALCSRMMRSISLKSEEGRSPGTVFLTLDVALPNCMAFCGLTPSNRPNSTRHIGVAGTDAVNDVDVGMRRLRVKRVLLGGIQHRGEIVFTRAEDRALGGGDNFCTPYSCA